MRIVFILVSLAAAVTSCGGDETGACVDSADLCYDGWSKDDCRLYPTGYSPGKTCAELGYTKSCSRSCHCRVSDRLCP